MRGRAIWRRGFRSQLPAKLLYDPPSPSGQRLRARLPRYSKQGTSDASLCHSNEGMETIYRHALRIRFRLRRLHRRTDFCSSPYMRPLADKSRRTGCGPRAINCGDLETMKRTIVVDAFTTGRYLPEALRERGVEVRHIMSKQPSDYFAEEQIDPHSQVWQNNSTVLMELK